MRFTFFLLTSIVAILLPGRPALAAPPAPPVIDNGGFLVEDAFRDFVLAHGGLDQFGPPLSDALIEPESGLTIQYFRYARLELHGAHVQLSRLGSMAAAGREGEEPFNWLPPDTPLAEGRSYLAESGHTLGGAFAWYHSSHGGVPILGYPISEEFVEPQPDGQHLLVQYFERAQLIYRPGEPDKVFRAPLGAWLAELRLTPEQRTPRGPLLPLARATIRYPQGSGDGHNIELATSRLDGAIVAPGATISFLRTIGEVSVAAGYVGGSGIVGGEISNSVVGGGICSVSTLLYRAAWSAGLPIVERRAHRYRLRAYADQPGLDAAVFTPNQDFRARNDTGARLYIVGRAGAGTAELVIWGRGDGRTVTTKPPVVQDAAGLEVLNERIIARPNVPVQRERVLTRYQPVPAPEPEPAEPESEPQPQPSGEHGPR